MGKLRRWVLLMMAGVALTGAAQKIGVKTNLLYDATLTPNLGLEVAVDPHWTIDMTVGYNPFSFDNGERKWKHVLVSPGVRYWFGTAYAGHFVGSNLVYAHYNVGGIHLPFGMVEDLQTNRYQGDLGGIGFSYGYAWRFSKHWGVEVNAGLGYGYTRYDRYNCITCGSYKGKESKHLLLFSKFGISVVYTI